MTQPAYQHFVEDEQFHPRYISYQQKYVEEPRESDKAMMSMIEDYSRSVGRQDLKLLDVGCSTGNLLLHLRNRMPQLQLAGGDLEPVVVADCQANPNLEGINFEILNMLDLKRENEFDIIVANVVMFIFEDENYSQALQSTLKALKPGGILLMYDFANPFNQDVVLRESSNSHPDGITLHFRSHQLLNRLFEGAGFETPDIMPFRIPITLDKPKQAQGGSYDDLISYTLDTVDGERLLLRGIINQPWAHIRARKPIYS